MSSRSVRLKGGSDEKGDYVTSSLEYETIWSMGGMLGNEDMDGTWDFNHF
ncbi:MAG: hypothetical protein ABFS43_03890 [Thermodesulfobacteriota bacterium]